MSVIGETIELDTGRHHPGRRRRLAIPVLETIASHSSSPVNYVFTPKNATSTIKGTLLRSEDHPHEVFRDLFCSGPVDVSKPFFVLTRNPFDRVVSAYLNKIGKGKDDNVWLAFCERYHVDPDSSPSFGEFLQILRNDEFPHEMDIHIRPQFHTNNFSFLRPYLTGRVEDIAEVARFLKQHGYDLLDLRPHATHAASWRQSLGSEHVRAIREIYRMDFESYGYDEDPLVEYVPPSLYQQQTVSAELNSVARLRGVITPGEILHYAQELRGRNEHRIAIALMTKALALNPLDKNLETEIEHYLREFDSTTMPGHEEVESVLLRDVVKLIEHNKGLKSQLEGTLESRDALYEAYEVLDETREALEARLKDTLRKLVHSEEAASIARHTLTEIQSSAVWRHYQRVLKLSSLVSSVFESSK